MLLAVLHLFASLFVGFAIPGNPDYGTVTLRDNFTSPVKIVFLDKL